MNSSRDCSLLLLFQSGEYSKPARMTCTQRVLLTRPRLREIRAMTREHDFVVDLAKAGKSAKEIKDLSHLAHGDKALSKTAIYRILAIVRKGGDADDHN